MLKQGTFINKKFNMFLLGNIWGWIAYCVNLMTDSLISGNQLGETSLQAVSIVYPLFSVIFFFSYLISPGASIIFGKRIGQFKQDEAYRTAGTCIISSFLINILLAASLWILKDPFLRYYECTGELYSEASNYYNWLILFAIISSVESSLNYLVVTDGESILLTLAGTSEIIINVGLSLVLSHSFGIAGLGMATCFGVSAKVISYLFHFLKKSNNVKFIPCLDLKIVGRSVVLGFSKYMMYLFMAVVDFVMNKIIIMTSGMEYIPAYSVVNLVFSICEVFGSLNDASVGFITCFLGENNKHDMHLVLRKLTVSILVMGSVITAFFFFSAPLMPLLYGLETPSTVAAAVMTTRIMSFTAIGFGACYISSEVSCAVEKPGQACFILFLCDIFSPMLLSFIFGYFFEFTGIAIGMSISTYFAFGIYAAVCFIRKGKTGFPIYFTDSGEEGISYDLIVGNNEIIKLRESINSELKNHGYDIENLDLLIDEFYTRILEKNPGKKVLSECTLLFGPKKVRIIIRDDGMIFNFLDENNRIESINTHVLNSLLENTKKKDYVLTTSFNRCGFIFEK